MGSSDREFEVEIVGNATLDELDRYANEMIERLEAEGGIVDMEMSLQVGLPEVRVVPDRDKAAALGVDAQTVADTVLAMIGGLDIATYREGEERYDVRMRLEQGTRDDLTAIGDLCVRAQQRRARRAAQPRDASSAARRRPRSRAPTASAASR